MDKYDRMVTDFSKLMDMLPQVIKILEKDREYIIIDPITREKFRLDRRNSG